ncbi:MAG: transposase [Rhodospirillum sp.]|nr:transposase [Rhodospirillum sp.]MCF8502983.1 transposase [Rhodospirillum sp.]
MSQKITSGQGSRLLPPHTSRERIIGTSREQEGSQKTADVCRRHGVSAGTFHAWRAKSGGMEISEEKRPTARHPRRARVPPPTTCSSP